MRNSRNTQNALAATSERASQHIPAQPPILTVWHCFAEDKGMLYHWAEQLVTVNSPANNPSSRLNKDRFTDKTIKYGTRTLLAITNNNLVKWKRQEALSDGLGLGNRAAWLSNETGNT